MVRKHIVSPLALVAALCVAACDNTAKVRGSSHEVRVGVLANFSNEYATTSGKPTMQAAQLFAKQVNDDGGLLVGGTRYRLELVFKDFDDRPDAAATAARTLINQDEVDVLIGPQFSRHAVPTAVLAENARVPMVSPMSSSPLTTRDKRYVFRLAFLDRVQAGAMARFAHDELDARKAAMLFNVSAKYSRYLADTFRETFEDLGGDVVLAETYTTDDDSDFGPALRRIREAQPDVLWLPNWTPATKRQLEQAGLAKLDVQFLGSDTWDLRTIGAMSEADGAFVTHQWHPDLSNPKTKEFVATYKSTYNENPGTTAAMTYDAFALLRQALAGQADVSPESIRDGLANVEAFEGVTGSIHYGTGGDPERPAVICRIEDGRAVVHRVIAAPTE